MKYSTKNGLFETLQKLFCQESTDCQFHSTFCSILIKQSDSTCSKRIVKTCFYITSYMELFSLKLSRFLPNDWRPSWFNSVNATYRDENVGYERKILFLVKKSFFPSCLNCLQMFDLLTTTRGMFKRNPFSVENLLNVQSWRCPSFFPLKGNCETDLCCVIKSASSYFEEIF